MPQSLLLKNALCLVTMDAQRREIKNGCVLVNDGVITQVGTDLTEQADTVLDMQGCIVMPGMVNTHHHMFQSLTRTIAQNAELFDWLQTLYPIWQHLTPEMVYISTQTAMAELLLSGCTTTSDHLYLYPNGCRLDDSIHAAHEIGMRFHATRGAMSVGQSAGGLPPDNLVEKENHILKDSQRLIEAYHNPHRYAMLRIGLAPCSPFSVSQNLMRETATMARYYGIGLHTHLAENINDVAYSLEKFNCTPAQYAEQLGWIGPDVWHAHCVQLDDAGIALFGHSKTGIAHCPSSNMRLASGIAPINKMRAAKVQVGLGVDGSASNDGGHLLAEARQAMLLARVRDNNPAALSPRDCLEMATRDGAAILQRNDIGSIEVGKAADIIAFDTQQLAYAGTSYDPVAALLLCQPQQVKTSIIQGRIVVANGTLQTLQLPLLLERHQKLAKQLLSAH